VVADGGLTIGSMLGHDAAEAQIVDAFLAQHERVVSTARTLAGDEWQEPSRCTAWTAHQLLIHMLGATAACRSTLTGEREVFAGGFDPNSGPASFVDLRRGEPVVRTIDDLEAETAATADAIAGLRGTSPAPTRTAVWGAQVDWRLFLAHMFWDGWMHERDLLLPLGRPVSTSEPEAQLAAAYGLHSAGIMNGLTGNPIDVTLQLAGTGAGTYSVTADGADVRVTVAAPATGAAPMGDVLIVSDAIAGRPPALADVLDAPAEVVGPLGRLAGFLNA
jgi:uncharacterized protein (TIGR03083 family)